MDKIYVTGHRNPDTDSIVSAMAYAALRNAVGDREYVAARLGQLSDETKAILERFGFEAPIFVKNMRTQVQDLDFDTPPILNQAVTVDRAWSAMEDDRHVSAIPITNDDGKLVGMLTPGDVAEYNMRNITDPTIQDIPLFNLLSVLEGKLLNEQGHAVNVLSGRVVIALPGGLDEYHPHLRPAAGGDPGCPGDGSQLHHFVPGGTAGGSAGQGRRYLHYCDSL